MLLLESPTHVIEHLKQAVASGDFSETNAYLFAGLAILVNGLNHRNPTPRAVDQLAHERSVDTTHRFEALVGRADRRELAQLTQAFRAENAQYIINHLNRFSKQLIDLYDEFDVPHYNDK